MKTSESENQNDVEVIVYAVGLVAASVCTNGTLENALTVIDATHPTGLGHGWSHSNDVFRGHHSNTLPCNNQPDTHTHYLLQC